MNVHDAARALADAQAQAVTEEVKAALRSPDGSIKIVQTFTHGKAVQVFRKTRKIGPMIIPNREGGQSLGDVLSMLGEWAEESPWAEEKP